MFLLLLLFLCQGQAGSIHALHHRMAWADAAGISAITHRASALERDASEHEDDPALCPICVDAELYGQYLTPGEPQVPPVLVAEALVPPAAPFRETALPALRHSRIRGPPSHSA